MINDPFSCVSIPIETLQVINYNFSTHSAPGVLLKAEQDTECKRCNGKGWTEVKITETRPCECCGGRGNV